MDFHIPNIAQGTVIPNSVYRKIQEEEERQQQLDELKRIADNAQRQAEASEAIADSARKQAEAAILQADLAIKAAEAAEVDATKARRHARISIVISILSVLATIISPFLSEYAEPIMEWLLKLF